MQVNENDIYYSFYKRIFDQFLSTDEYSESEKSLLWEMLLHNPLFVDTHARCSTKRSWFDNYQAAEKLLAEKFQRGNLQPLAGDSVYIECSNGTIYENALIAYSPNSLNEKFVVVTQGGGHICNVHQSPTESLKMEIAGGYFEGVYPDEFELETDSVQKSFWFWAERPCAHGGLYITRPVIRWRLKQINPNFY